MINSTTTIKTAILAFIIALISLSFSTNAPAQSTRTGNTFVKTFNHEDIAPKIDIDAEIEIVPSDRTNVRFLITVNNKHFRSLVEVGRYSIKRNVVDGQVVYTMPNLARDIVINGQILEDNITVTVLVPNYAEATVQTR